MRLPSDLGLPLGINVVSRILIIIVFVIYKIDFLQAPFGVSKFCRFVLPCRQSKCGSKGCPASLPEHVPRIFSDLFKHESLNPQSRHSKIRTSQDAQSLAEPVNSTAFMHGAYPLLYGLLSFAA